MLLKGTAATLLLVAFQLQTGVVRAFCITVPAAVPKRPKNTRGTVAIGFDIERMFENEEPYFTLTPPAFKPVVYPGPKWDVSPECTDYVRKLMDIADENGVKLQFFALGHSVEVSSEIFREILTHKYHLQQHTYSHLSLLSNIDQVMQEVNRTQRIFGKELGYRPVGLRAPGAYTHGITSRLELQEQLRAAGIQYVSTMYDQTATMENMQPFLLPSGLLEIPMYGYSDWNFALRPGATLRQWLTYVRDQVNQAYQKGLVYAPALHPCLEAALDPDAKTLQTIIRTAKGEPQKMWIPSYDELAKWFLKNGRH
jgi:peptidoglycan/xylan/chitin deacetylase (PgdA/CDA1 family)